LLLRRYFNPLYHLLSTSLCNLAPARWPLLHTLLASTLIPGIPAINFVLHARSVDHPRAPFPFSPHHRAAQVLLSTVGVDIYSDYPRTPYTNSNCFFKPLFCPAQPLLHGGIWLCRRSTSSYWLSLRIDNSPKTRSPRSHATNRAIAQVFRSQPP
jgi:hypothetical protein